MMRALLSVEPGPPETLQLSEVPEPSPGSGELLVRVRACAINYPDVLIIEDKYQFRPPRPFAPGGEVAGEVEGAGPEGTDAGNKALRDPAIISKASVSMEADDVRQARFDAIEVMDKYQGSLQADESSTGEDGAMETARTAAIGSPDSAKAAGGSKPGPKAGFRWSIGSRSRS